MADEVDSGGGRAPDSAAGPAPVAPRPARSGPGRIWSGVATLFGAVSLVGGLTWVLLNLHSPAPVVDLGTGVVLALGGLVLLMPHRIRLPGAVTGIAAVATAVVGTAAGIAAGATTVCCTYAYVVDRGFPFHWLQRGAVADDPEVARRLAATDSWHVDVAGLTMNVIVWAYLGVLVTALVVLVRRARSPR